MHPRTTIRTTLQDILVAAATDAGNNVRREPLALNSLRVADLPVILIWFGDEDVVEELPGSERERTRLISATIECIVAPGDDVDVRMDTLADQVERALGADRYLRPPVPPPGYQDGDIATDCRLDSTTMVMVATGQQMTGYVGMVWEIEYRDFAAVAPEAEDFLIADTTYDPNGSTDPGDRPADTIFVREVA